MEARRSDHADGRIVREPPQDMRDLLIRPDQVNQIGPAPDMAEQRPRPAHRGTFAVQFADEIETVEMALPQQLHERADIPAPVLHEVNFRIGKNPAHFALEAGITFVHGDYEPERQGEPTKRPGKLRPEIAVVEVKNDSE